MRKRLSRLLARLYARAEASHRHWTYERYREMYCLHPTFRFVGVGIRFHGDGALYAGEGSHIGEWSTIYVHPRATVRIGRGCRLAHNVRLYTATSDADARRLTSGELPEIVGDISIGDDVWIGVNSFIGPGVSIGSDAVVGANSVVTHDVPAHTIVGGVPAKTIRRKQDATRA